MSEKIRFSSEEEKKEQKLAETLKVEGGVFYREAIDPKTGETKRFANIVGVEVETRASKEDIEAIKKEVVLSETDQELLRSIVESYKLREPLMFEGDPGVGKTFLMKKFVQLLHGKDAPILELVGTPRTSELEILGHWAPKGLKEKENEEYQTLLKGLMEGTPMKDLSTELNQRIGELNQKILTGEISQEQFQEEFGELTTQYVNTSRSRMTEMTGLAKLIKPNTEWEFKEGALLQAYSGREGKGCILIVDEFNLIPSNYQQIFLQIGGEKGILSDSISFWGNTGKTRYPRGQDAWICFASNFPEKTPGRNEVVGPMTDRLVWKSISSEEAEKKEQVLLGTAGGRLIKRTRESAKIKPEIIQVPVHEGLVWDKVLNEQLGESIADVVNLLHIEFRKYCQGVGDNISIKGEKRKRTQQFEFSGRNSLRFYGYLDHFQVREPKTGMVDFAKTLENAYKRYYLNRLVDPVGKERMQTLFNEIMTGVTGKTEFEGEVRTRKEILNILVERASTTEEEKKKIEKMKEEEKRRELEQLKYNTEDNIEDLLNNPDIPESIKKVFLNNF